MFDDKLIKRYSYFNRISIQISYEEKHEIFEISTKSKPAELLFNLNERLVLKQRNTNSLHFLLVEQY